MQAKYSYTKNKNKVFKKNEGEGAFERLGKAEVCTAAVGTAYRVL